MLISSKLGQNQPEFDRPQQMSKQRTKSDPRISQMSKIILILFLLIAISPSLQDNCRKACILCDPVLGICSQCAEGYYWDPFLIMCRIVASNPISGCKYYRTASSCSECFPGFLLNQGSCFSCQVQNCVDCTGNLAQCVKCASGKGATSATSKDCSLSCQVDNCELCSPGNTNQCQTCMPGYRRASATSCVQCSDKNCLRCPTDVLLCQVLAGKKTCVNTHFWNGRMCQPCSKGCSKCDRDGFCLRCNHSAEFFMKSDQACYSGDPESTSFYFGGILRVGMTMVLLSMVLGFLLDN